MPGNFPGQGVSFLKYALFHCEISMVKVLLTPSYVVASNPRKGHFSLLEFAERDGIHGFSIQYMIYSLLDLTICMVVTPVLKLH